MATVKADLLTPTLGEHRPRDWSARLPWRLGSQVYPAILGGPVAATMVAIVNARRLRMQRRTIALMALGGLVASAAGIAAVLLVDGDAPRLLIAAAGLAAYGGFYLAQRAPDRVHSTFSPHEDPDDDYGRFFAAGLAAILVSLALQVLVIVALGGLE